MLNIDKQAPPKSLIVFQKTPGANYRGLDKTDIKKSLLEEQGHLCCYCMRRIKFDSMQVEHWKAKSVHPELQLDYSNLLGVCPEAQGQPFKMQCCDTSKRNKPLKFSPADPACDVEARLTYTGDGRIQAPNDAEFDRQLQDVLKLNLAYHCNDRKSVRKAVMTVLGNKNGPRTKSQIQGLVKRSRARDVSNALDEYVGVTIYFLRLKEKSAPR